MPSSLSHVPTWKIVSVSADSETGGGYFSWVPVNFDSISQEQKKIIDSTNTEEHLDDGILTGSGSYVSDSEGKSSIKNANAYLEGERSVVNDVPKLCTGMGNPLLWQEHSIKESESIQEINLDLPMFRNGSGRALAASTSSIRKAQGILEDSGDLNKCTTRLGKGVFRGSFISKETSIIGEEGCSNNDQMGVSIVRKAGEGCSEVDCARSLEMNEGFEDYARIRETVIGSAGACQISTSSVSLRHNSIHRAVAILEEQSPGKGVDSVVKHQTEFNTPFGIRQSSPQKNVLDFGVEDVTNRGQLILFSMLVLIFFLKFGCYCY